MFWVWPMGTQVLHKLGQKIIIFRGFSKIFSELLDSKFLILIYNSLPYHEMGWLGPIFGTFHDLLTSLQPLNHLTLRIYSTVSSLSVDSKNMQFSITLISSLFKPANMRSCNFRNGLTWPYTGYKAHSSCFFPYSCNSRTNELLLLEHQK